MQVRRGAPRVLPGGSLAGAPGINYETLAARGFSAEKITAAEKAVATAFDIKFAFNKWTLGEAFLTGPLKLPAERIDQPDVGAGLAEVDDAELEARARGLDDPVVRPAPIELCETNHGWNPFSS